MAKRGKKGSQKSGKSPYVKYGKRETVYSPEYQAWRSAVKSGRGVEAANDNWHAKHNTNGRRSRDMHPYVIPVDMAA